MKPSTGRYPFIHEVRMKVRRDAMPGEEILVFWIGTAVFGIATVMFRLLRPRRAREEFLFGSHVFVSFITTVTYVTMALALGTVIAANGEPIYWTRWLFYIGSCSILTLDVALIAGKTSAEKAEIGLFTGLVMFCGFLASILIGPERWWFFGLSSAAYIGLLYTLFAGLSRAKPGTNMIVWFVLVFWSLFPVVWVLAPTGFGLIGPFVVAILYGLLDIITKIIFGIWIIYRYRDMV
jgi:sensory rhodopsin